MDADGSASRHFDDVGNELAYLCRQSRADRVRDKDGGHTDSDEVSRQLEHPCRRHRPFERTRERGAGWAVVEQDAESRLMMFSKRIHLVLQIEERPEALIFRDRCGQTFARYDGAWRLSSEDGHTVITYELTAEPSFDVPGVILKRILRRNSGRMIASLQQEIAARGTQ